MNHNTDAPLSFQEQYIHMNSYLIYLTRHQLYCHLSALFWTHAVADPKDLLQDISVLYSAMSPFRHYYKQHVTGPSPLIFQRRMQTTFKFQQFQMLCLIFCIALTIPCTYSGILLILILTGDCCLRGQKHKTESSQHSSLLPP